MGGDVRARPCRDVWEWFRAFREAELGGDGRVSTHLTKAVGAMVATHVDSPQGKKPGGNAWPSWDTLAEYVGVDRSAVGKALDVLAETGWLIRHKPHRTRTIYQLAVPVNGDGPAEAGEPAAVSPPEGGPSKEDIHDDLDDIRSQLNSLSEDVRRKLRRAVEDAIPEDQRKWTHEALIERRMWALWIDGEDYWT